MESSIATFLLRWSMGAAKGPNEMESVLAEDTVAFANYNHYSNTFIGFTVL